ncbi:hypothetical protein Patl1_17763 [Pistacia atlantica]|uniref:Uncharacterized protein n=1 Tax=Pistacia atlantica TaxID=434234 RepID=A0ACC1BXT2_9ROSI|nr:hypothetical protein Patl1_17763 [Pistacia atlantica]
MSDLLQSTFTHNLTQKFDSTDAIKSSMFCSSTRLLVKRNLNIQSISTSLLLAKHLTSVSEKALLIYRQSKPLSFVFPSNQRAVSKPVLFTLRSDHTMASQSKTSVHDFTVKDARGNDVDLSTYKGKVLLIVNVASQCGLTNSNYTELSQLYQKYKDQGLEILAFPCNQFGAQEPGNNEQILEFACTRFKAEYPIFDKAGYQRKRKGHFNVFCFFGSEVETYVYRIRFSPMKQVDVNGDNAAPIYKFLKSNKGGLFGDSIKWNFSKFLVDKEGKVVERYAPTTSPLSIEKDVKKLLAVA